MTQPFTPGLRLAGAYYAEVVRPLLAEAYPGLAYSAALLGWGSEVLGFDSPRSTDHNWGPRLQIFLAEDTAPGQAGIDELLARRLPRTFRGYPTVFGNTEQPAAAGAHWVEVAPLRGWLNDQLGFDPVRQVSLLDWLATPTQRLAEVTAGEVFHDGLGELTTARTSLAWYPADIWRYVLACQWQRIGQEEAFPGRCSEAADELGSAIVTARLARDLMRLWLLMHRRFPPYSKWLGTSFAKLQGVTQVARELTGAVAAADWPARERHLSRAYELTAAQHNRLGLTEPLPVQTRPYFDRPYQVIEAGRFTEALRDAITDEQVRRLPAVGAVDQFVDSTDALGDLGLLRAAVRTLLPAPPAAAASAGRASGSA